MTTVTLIGAGSAEFAAELVTDFLSVDALPEGQFRLVDTDPVRLELARRFAEHLIERTGKAWTVRADVDRAAVLAGSDVVINTIEVAGLRNVRHDYDIPLRHGVDQCIGDTIGPGGLFKAFRTIPAWLEILGDIERSCPEALVLNHTNPMSMMVLAASRASSIPVYGMCHSVHYTVEQLAEYLEADLARLTFRAAGVNHLAWITELWLDGEDAYPMLRERGRVPEVWEQDPVRFELMFHLGRFPTESSGHVSEYLPSFRSHPETLKRYARPGYRGESGYYANNWPTWRTESDERLARVLAGDEEYPMERGGEYPSRIVEAMATGEPVGVYVNVPNDGWIANLERGGVVEVEAVVDRDGIRPQRFGALPPQLAALDRRHLEIHDLAVTALLERDRELAVQALMLDPLTSAVCAPAEIRAMFDEMVAAEREDLPSFLEI
ncbi:MAG TPA: alpha-glucosidase/alpha-galactosidase [Actinomycetota bacterium]|nr:alpha-glucosidase/alpha-galactosidase [Actinomycetota bacterium]